MQSEFIQNSLGAYEVHTGDFSREFVEKISNAQDEPNWMRERRLEAYSVYETLPMPHTTPDAVWRKTTDMHTQDYWRRTTRHMRGLKLDGFQPVALSPSGPSNQPPSADSQQMNLPLNGETSGLIALQDGRVIKSALLKDLERKGVYFADMNTALKERPEFFRSHFMTKAVTVDWNYFDALHGAFWQGGYLLHVPRGVVVEIPLRVFVALSESQRADLAHTIIVAEADSQFSILEEHVSTDANTSGLHCGAVEIFIDRNAHVNYVQIQKWNHHVWNFSTQRAIVGRDAQLRWVTAVLGSRLSKMNQVSILEGTGSHVDMLGLTFAHARQHIDIHTYQEHKAPHTTSDLLYKIVLKDRSTTAWSGMIYVHPEGQYTDAYQKNDNLVLDKRAHADTLPGLEILASEGIRCTHGATAGPIDKDQVFYLMSRGLSYDEAEKMIVDGFFEPVVQRVPLESIQKELQESVTYKLAV